MSAQRPGMPPRMPPVAAARMVEGAASALDALKTRLLPAPAIMGTVLSGGMILARCVSAAAELRVADHLAEGPRDVEELARLCDCNVDALYRFLRALAGHGIFEELDGRRFQLNRLSECLRSDVPMSLRGWAHYAGVEWYWQLWGSFVGTLRNGKTVHENLHERRFFEWYEENPEYAEVFDEAMSSFSRVANPAIVAGYDFAALETLVDVGGGQGSLLGTILHACPRLRGTLFDQPQVIEKARLAADLADPAVAERCEFVTGSFFDELPPGRDAYLFKWILHDWTDDEVRRILRNCRRAMAQGGPGGGRGRRLLVVEMLIEPGNRPSPAKLLDIAMLALTGGRERTAAEFRALFEETGFLLQGIHPTVSPYSVIEAIAV
ncbi:MAG TPA: methyltransferase [Polyangia bacterium]|nr:methyltransferase [Polyangia bacterium]